MGLLADLKENLVAAQKSGDGLRRDTLRQIINTVRNREIDSRSELSDSNIHAIIAKLVNQHKDSIAQFEKGGRADLAENEAAELAILSEYLPPQLTDEELDSMVAEAIEKTGATDMKQMGAVMKELKDSVTGRADGKTVSEKVKAKLAAL